MSGEIVRIARSLEMQTVMRELTTLSILRPGQSLAVSKHDHSFIIIDKSQKLEHSVYDTPEKLLERLEDIQIMVNEILSPSSDVPLDQFNELSIAIFRALEAVKLVDRKSPLISKISSIKDKIFSGTSVKRIFPRSQSVPEKLCELQEDTPREERLSEQRGPSALILSEKISPDHIDDSLSEKSLADDAEKPSSLTPPPQIARPVAVKLTGSLKKSPSTPDLRAILQDQLEERHADAIHKKQSKDSSDKTLSPPSCESVPALTISCSRVRRVERAVSALYYTSESRAYPSFLNRWLTEYSHPTKLLKYQSVVTSFVQSFEKSVSEEIFRKNISIIEILTLLEPFLETLEICKLTHELLSIIASKEKYHLDCRVQYTEFNQKLREILLYISSIKDRAGEISEDEKLCLRLIDTICYIKYTGVKIYPFLYQTVDRFICHSPAVIALDTAVTCSDLPTVLCHDNDQIEAAPLELKKPQLALTYQKLSGSFNVNFDPTAVINIPYLRSIQHYGRICPLEEVPIAHAATASEAAEIPFVSTGLIQKEVLYLRHGTPTQEIWLSTAALATLSRCASYWSWGWIPTYHNAVVIPEYDAFIESCFRRGDMVLYCNHQKMELATFCDESDRCSAIKLLETKYLNFQFLSLPMGDGALFREWSDIRKTEKTTDFQIKFIDAYLQDLHGIYIPQSCKDEALLPELQKIFSDVHRLYFENKEELTYRDTVIFTLAFNTYLKEYIKFHSYEKMVEKASSEDERQRLIHGRIITVSACKDNIDRGGTSTTLDEFLNLVILGEEDNPERIKELRVSHAAPAIVVKKQNVIPDRQILVELFIDHFNHLSAHQKQAIRSYTPYNWKLIDHSVAI